MRKVYHLNGRTTQGFSGVPLNDWRTAIIRGLKASPEFDISVVQNIIGAINSINEYGA